MTEETYRILDLIIKVFGGAIAITGAVVAYLNFKSQIEKNRQEREAATRQQTEELRWRRAQFLIEFWRDFNADKTLRPCIKLVDSGDRDSKLAALLLVDPWTLRDADSEIRYEFDRYFDLLQSLAYCEEKGTLTLDEVGCFGWHFEKLVQSSTLTKYCSENGYENVVALAQKMLPDVQEASSTKP